MPKPNYIGEKYKHILLAWEDPINLHTTINTLCEWEDAELGGFMDWLCQEPIRSEKFIEIRQTRDAIRKEEGEKRCG